MRPNSEKSHFDGPRFYDVQCVVCGGTGRRQRWGIGVRLRKRLLGSLSRACPTCEGRCTLKFAYTRRNTLELWKSWRYTQDGLPWTVENHHSGRMMTWRELDAVIQGAEVSSVWYGDTGDLDNEPPASMSGESEPERRKSHSNVHPLRPPELKF